MKDNYRQTSQTRFSTILSRQRPRHVKNQKIFVIVIARLSLHPQRDNEQICLIVLNAEAKCATP